MQQLHCSMPLYTAAALYSFLDLVTQLQNAYLRGAGSTHRCLVTPLYLELLPFLSPGCLLAVTGAETDLSRPYVLPAWTVQWLAGPTLWTVPGPKHLDRAVPKSEASEV